MEGKEGRGGRREKRKYRRVKRTKKRRKRGKRRGREVRRVKKKVLETTSRHNRLRFLYLSFSLFFAHLTILMLVLRNCSRLTEC